MYGPTFNIELNKDNEYHIPYGIGGDGYMYYKGKFIGELEQHVSHWKTETYLAFETIDKKGYALCVPNIRIWDGNLQITLDPKSFGDTLLEALNNLKSKYRWKFYVSEVETEHPDLGEFKKI